MNKVVEGLVDTGVSAFERGAYALFDPSMSWEEKLAYTFDPKQMAFDFVSGIIIGEAVDWVASKVHIGKPKRENGTVINTSSDGPNFGELLSESSLNRRQRELLDTLRNQGDTALVRKKSVSMNDLRQLTYVTGDEFNMFTQGGQRLIIRGEGSNIVVSPEMYDDLINGVYGKFSGHTHPAGHSLKPGPADEPFLKALGQKRSSVWGTDGWNIFGQDQWLTEEAQQELRREMYKKMYGMQ